MPTVPTAIDLSMRCPVCGGTTYQAHSPGLLLCTSQVVADAVPPGVSGNFSLQPVPIYGPCEAVASEAEWRAAGKRAESLAREHEAKRAREEARMAREADQRQHLEQRQSDLLAALHDAGNPGQEARRVPGRYYLSPLDRILGRVGKDVLVDVESAWPLGSFTWMDIRSHGTEHFADIATGFTASGRFVPMEYATAGDPVEMLYRRRSMPDPGLHPRQSIRMPTTRDVVGALEHAAESVT
jgi:hypothetical protein